MIIILRFNHPTIITIIIQLILVIYIGVPISNKILVCHIFSFKNNHFCGHYHESMLHVYSYSIIFLP